MQAQNLYLAQDVRTLDQTIINEFAVPGYTLMESAGAAAFEVLRAAWPAAKKLVVVCGRGNNAGDGYIVARLAHKFGYDVRVISLVSFEKLQGDALTAARAATDVGVKLINCEERFDSSLLLDADTIVDGIFGTGLDRVVEGRWFEVIQSINQTGHPVLALDIPSGLNADTGAVLGIAVEAQHTVSFIGLKQGLFTGMGRHHCGEVHFDDLNVPQAAYERVVPASHLVSYQTSVATCLQPRIASAHKGYHGHVLGVGGDSGMLGALRLVGEAALRSGAGLVSLATRQRHAAQLSAERPELMSHGVESVAELRLLLKKASIVAIGPGLGQGEWARLMLSTVLETDKPLVVDADALNLLSQEACYRDNWVLTPHPGEAARLLGVSTQEIENNRFKAVREIQARYGGTVVLKGAGSLICYGQQQQIDICGDGNPGMAVGGMGDVLTGVIASMVAQQTSSPEVVRIGVCLHSAAADCAAQRAPRGMLASDLFPHLRKLVNP